MKRAQRVGAIQLRRNGADYPAILSQLNVAKSTLWRWLKSEGLVETHPQRLIECKRLAQQKAAAVVKANRIARTQAIVEAARRDIGSLTNRELLVIGTALYWVEGAKQKESSPPQASERVVFSNTDPRMLRLFVKFLNECCEVPSSTLTFRIYLHETANAEVARAYWSTQLGLEAIRTTPLTWKRHKPAMRRTNVGEKYHGLLRIVVRKSTNLNRRIQGWTNALCAAVGE